MALDSLKLSVGQRTFLSQAAHRYADQLDQQTASYLLGRGIGKEDAKHHLLGYVGSPEAGHDSYQGRLSIPYITPLGVVGFRFRDLVGQQPKYLSPVGQAPRLYNTRDLVHNQGTVAVCEGELDALIMSRRVGIPAVGVPGGNAWKDHHPRCFADVERVLIVMDSDAAGEGFAQKIARSLPESKIIRPPSGHDVGSWFCEYGADPIRKACGL